MYNYIMFLPEPPISIIKRVIDDYFIEVKV